MFDHCPYLDQVCSVTPKLECNISDKAILGEDK